MRLAGILGLAILLMLGLAESSSQAAKAKKVKSEVEIEETRFVSGQSEFFGDVHSKKPKCEKGRDVTLVHLGPPPAPEPVLGTDTTDATGDWEITPSTVYAGNYVVEVDRKKAGKGDRRLICKPATSPQFLVVGG
jgi:hypothetical protein